MHKFNKSNMINDIVLTISLIISLTLAEMIMALGNVTENQAIVFFILAFVLIKITYNKLSKFARIIQSRLGIRK